MQNLYRVIGGYYYYYATINNKIIIIIIALKSLKQESTKRSISVVGIRERDCPTSDPAGR